MHLLLIPVFLALGCSAFEGVFKLFGASVLSLVLFSVQPLRFLMGRAQLEMGKRKIVFCRSKKIAVGERSKAQPGRKSLGSTAGPNVSLGGPAGFCFFWGGLCKEKQLRIIMRECKKNGAGII